MAVPLLRRGALVRWPESAPAALMLRSMAARKSAAHAEKLRIAGAEKCVSSKMPRRNLHLCCSINRDITYMA